MCDVLMKRRVAKMYVHVYVRVCLSIQVPCVAGQDLEVYVCVCACMRVSTISHSKCMVGERVYGYVCVCMFVCVYVCVIMVCMHVYALPQRLGARWRSHIDTE